MSESFTKLFSSIVHSTIWNEPDHVRLTWVTMLALADRDGIVHASVPGLAHAARKTVAEVEDALEKFMSPDKYSRTPDFEGRRVEPVPGGWRLLTYEIHRERASKEHAKAKAAERQARKRARDAEKRDSSRQEREPSRPKRDESRVVTRSHDKAEAEAEAKAEDAVASSPPAKPEPPPVLDDDAAPARIWRWFEVSWEAATGQTTAGMYTPLRKADIERCLAKMSPALLREELEAFIAHQAKQRVQPENPWLTFYGKFGAWRGLGARKAERAAEARREALERAKAADRLSGRSGSQVASAKETDERLQRALAGEAVPGGDVALEILARLKQKQQKEEES